RAVQTYRFDFDADQLLALQLGKESIQHARLGPAVHASVDRMPVAKALRQRAPLAAVLGHKEDRVDHVEVLVRAVAALSRQMRLDARILLRRKFHRATVSTIIDCVNRPSSAAIFWYAPHLRLTGGVLESRSCAVRLPPHTQPVSRARIPERCPRPSAAQWPTM